MIDLRPIFLERVRLGVGRDAYPVVTSESTLESATNAIAAEYKSLIAELEDGGEDLQIDKVRIAMLRRFLATVMGCVPKAEAVYNQTKSERAAYAMSTLINQAQQLASDIANAQDLGQQVEFIMNSIVQPALTNMLQNMINEVFQLRAAALAVTPSGERDAMGQRFELMLRSQASYMKEVGVMVNDKLNTYMVEDPAANAKQKRKH
jgi:hypothetical protein